MVTRVLVPLDGSVTAEAILPQVRRLLRRSDSEVILVRAANPPPTELPVYEASLAAAREYILGVRDRLVREGVRAEARARLGSPAGAILEIAAEEKATLIAMATHGRTGFSRALLGSVAEQVLRNSPVPVFVIRPFWSYEVAPTARPEDQPIRNILVPVDGSEGSLSVMPQAVDFAKLFEARVVLLRVLEPGTLAAGMSGVEGADRDLAQEQLKEAASRFQEKGLSTLTLVDQGDAAEVILGTCRFHGIDLVAMTTHGRSGISRLVMGSVTEKVLRGATVPMMVVRAVEATRPERHKTAAGKGDE